MTKLIVKTALTGAAAVMALSTALAVPSFASAQEGYYYGNQGYSYDPCRRDSTNRGTTGALIGSAIGAAIGSNAAARNSRTEGAILGGVVGAAIGAKVGKSSAACGRAPQSSYYGNSYGNQYGSNGYYNNGYDNGYGYGYGNSYGASYGGYGQYQGGAYPVNQGRATDGCTLAESPIYLPDGRVQKRMVRVCPDSRGNYQVVD